MASLTPAHALAVVRWQWARWTRLRWAAPAALLAALALVAVAAVANWRAGQRLEASRLAAVTSQVPAQAAAPAAGGNRAAVRSFIQSLPVADAPPEVVQGLFDLAEQQGLRLLRGSYRLQPEPAAAFARYRMTMPVQGDPARVERFVQEALLAWPTLAVEGIQFKRAPGGGRVLEARIQWVLFVQSQAAALRAPGAAS